MLDVSLVLVLRPFRGREDITDQTLIASQQEDMMNYCLRLFNVWRANADSLKSYDSLRQLLCRPSNEAR